MSNSTKSEARHTPGPWDASATGIWATSTWNARVRIAEATTFSRMNGIDAVANANLIAAAPDLLEALRRLLSSVDSGNASTHDDGCRCVYHEASAAIAKATGAAA